MHEPCKCECCRCFCFELGRAPSGGLIVVGILPPTLRTFRFAVLYGKYLTGDLRCLLKGNFYTPSKPVPRPSAFGSAVRLKIPPGGYCVSFLRPPLPFPPRTWQRNKLLLPEVRVFFFYTNPLPCEALLPATRKDWNLFVFGSGWDSVYTKFFSKLAIPVWAIPDLTKKFWF